MDFFSYETFGYFASALIVTSLAMRSLLKLRIINLAGAGSMALYGVFIEAYPVAVLNAMIVFVDIYYLFEMLKKKDFFSLLEVRRESKYLSYFLNYYEKEIRQFLPDFSYQASDPVKVFFILRNLVPAGLFITESGSEGRLLVKLDFVIPGYRDFKVGKFVYGRNSKLLEADDIKMICAEPGAPAHETYLKKMGFVLCEEGGGNERYQLCLG